jgi:undecaprenyl diphosphate synthase
MDGNGRWAQSRGLPRTAGHRRGVDAARATVDTAARLGVRYLTLFAFSSENWKRPAAEISDLMGLLRRFLTAEMDRLRENGVRLKVIGERTQLPRDIVRLIAEGERATASNQQLTLMIALSYGGRADLVAAARRLAARAVAGEITPETIDEALLAGSLETAGIPDPDLLIRTGGEKRISNFLIWPLAYTELVFLDLLWPDFSPQDFEAALGEYGRRERRYGAVMA